MSRNKTDRGNRAAVKTNGKSTCAVQYDIITLNTNTYTCIQRIFTCPTNLYVGYNRQTSSTGTRCHELSPVSGHVSLSNINISTFSQFFIAGRYSVSIQCIDPCFWSCPIQCIDCQLFSLTYIHFFKTIAWAFPKAFLQRCRVQKTGSGGRI
jgi:hypothetical protein